MIRRWFFPLLVCLVLSACAVPKTETDRSASPEPQKLETAAAEEQHDSVQTPVPTPSPVPEAEETASPQEALFRTSDMEEALSLFETGGSFLFVDVRTPDEYAQGHIPGAVNIPKDTIGEEPVPELPDPDQTLLVYCRSGVRSLAASEKLAAAGYTHVVNIGGIQDWKGKTRRGWEP